MHCVSLSHTIINTKGIAISILDGDDLIASMGTGAGKTGFFSFLTLIVHAISQDPSLALEGKVSPRMDGCLLFFLQKH